MKEIKNVDELRSFLWRFEKLQKVARSLHRQDENACNVELSKWQESRVKSLEKEASLLAGYLGLLAFHQRDPRGCPIYLLDKWEDRDNYSTKGIGVY